MKDTVVTTSFAGGISPYEKVSVGAGYFDNAQARFVKGLNIHEDVSYVTQHQKTTKVSATTVTALPKWMVDATPHNTNRYATDADGNIYKITSAESWSKDRAGTTIGDSAAGQGLAIYNNTLWYATDTLIGALTPLDNSPSYDDDYFSGGVFDVDQELSATGQTYTLQTSITETATHRQTFVPTRDPLDAVVINVDTVGSGDWTVTVHDSQNNSVGSKTIVNASMSTGDVTFTFASPLRLTIGNTYHFHVTVSTGTSKITTSTASDHETCDFQTRFGILLSDASWHPLLSTPYGLVIGNVEYIGLYNDSTYNPNAVSIDKGYKIRALTYLNEFIVAAAWRGTDITNVEQGKLYYWDGISSQFNFYEDVPVGLPNAIINHRNRLLGVYGTRGGMFYKADEFEKVNQVPQLTRGKKVEVYPGAITSWNDGKTYIGVAGSTDDGSTLVQGVYEFGTKLQGVPDALTLSHVVSTGTETATTLKIGMVAGFGKDLYIGWDDNGTYGVDKVIKSDNPATAGSWESLIHDNNKPYKNKLAIKVIIEHDALASGESITPKHRVDRAASFTNGTTNSTAGSTQTVLDLNKRYKEIEWGFNFVASTSYFRIKAVYFEFDDLVVEKTRR